MPKKRSYGGIDKLPMRVDIMRKSRTMLLHLPTRKS
jgi:hypothetical protein